MKNAIATAFALALLSSTAWADSIVFSGAVSLSGNGFGSNTSALTIQSHGPASNSEAAALRAALLRVVALAHRETALLEAPRPHPSVFRSRQHLR
jgi:hypothetical protein